LSVHRNENQNIVKLLRPAPVYDSLLVHDHSMRLPIWLALSYAKCSTTLGTNTTYLNIKPSEFVLDFAPPMSGAQMFP
jgi:uncharacterized membrane protein YwaF